MIMSYSVVLEGYELCELILATVIMLLVNCDHLLILDENNH